MGKVRRTRPQCWLHREPRKNDYLANSAAQSVARRGQKINTKFEQQEQSHSGSRSERNCARRSVQRHDRRPGTVVRFFRLAYPVTRSDCVPRGIRPLPYLGDGKPYNSGYWRTQPRTSSWMPKDSEQMETFLPTPLGIVQFQSRGNHQNVLRAGGV